jgi:hypothetical protein
LSISTKSDLGQYGKENIYNKENTVKETFSYKESGYKGLGYEANNYKDNLVPNNKDNIVPNYKELPVSNYKDHPVSNYKDHTVSNYKENNEIIKLIPAPNETEPSSDIKAREGLNYYNNLKDGKDYNKYSTSLYNNAFKKPEVNLSNTIEDNTGKFDTEELMEDTINFKEKSNNKYNDYMGKYNYYDNSNVKKDSPKKSHNYINEAPKKYVGDSPGELRDTNYRNKYQSEKRIYRDTKSKTISGSQDNVKG